MKKLLFIAATAIAISLTLSSCGSGNNSSSSSSTSQASGSSTTATGPATTSTLSSTHCSTAQLRGSLGETQSGAGQRYTALILTNTGTKACDLRGFPGVSLLDASAKEIGQPASREGSEGPLVSIAPGQSASASLHTSAAGLGATCEPTATQIKVYPPDNTASLSIQAAYSACGGFRVTTLIPGSTGN
ncbi:MAG: DUF4232 domain-containing protein [Acidimicrobiales bacterium]